MEKSKIRGYAQRERSMMDRPCRSSSKDVSVAGSPDFETGFFGKVIYRSYDEDNLIFDGTKQSKKNRIRSRPKIDSSREAKGTNKHIKISVNRLNRTGFIKSDYQIGKTIMAKTLGKIDKNHSSACAIGNEKSSYLENDLKNSRNLILLQEEGIENLEQKEITEKNRSMEELNISDLSGELEINSRGSSVTLKKGSNYRKSQKELKGSEKTIERPEYTIDQRPDLQDYEPALCLEPDEEDPPSPPVLIKITTIIHSHYIDSLEESQLPTVLQKKQNPKKRTP